MSDCGGEDDGSGSGSLCPRGSKVVELGEVGDVEEVSALLLSVSERVDRGPVLMITDSFQSVFLSLGDLLSHTRSELNRVELLCLLACNIKSTCRGGESRDQEGAHHVVDSDGGTEAYRSGRGKGVSTRWDETVGPVGLLIYSRG